MLMYAMLGLVNEKMSRRVDQKIFKWFGHVERIGDERLTKKVYKSELGGKRARGRSRLRWVDEVKDACGDSRMGLATARWKCRSRSEWRGVTDEIL